MQFLTLSLFDSFIHFTVIECQVLARCYSGPGTGNAVISKTVLSHVGEVGKLQTEYKEYKQVNEHDKSSE
jgi:hypothetical protein